MGMIIKSPRLKKREEKKKKREEKSGMNNMSE